VTEPQGSLPPGQRAVVGFPRFGVDLRRPPPAVPDDPVLAVRGAVRLPVDLPLHKVMTDGRQDLEADLHCVAGWSATGMVWQGVPFATVYRTLLRPRLRPGSEVTHVLFRGLDGFCSVLLLEDALQPDVLLADRLDGRPLDGDHGAPLRLVSPHQYGYVSTKHVTRVELHTQEPVGLRTSRRARVRWWLLGLHPRARVQLEERHPQLPVRLVRPVFRLLAGRIRRDLWRS
jgi:DMSO/TMAO reductase YedYZ molybdopterin-dependent catalytic subunit